MSGALQHLSMKKAVRAADVETLIREIQRYLVYLDAIRTSNRTPKRRGGGRSPEMRRGSGADHEDGEDNGMTPCAICAVAA